MPCQPGLAPTFTGTNSAPRSVRAVSPCVEALPRCQPTSHPEATRRHPLWSCRIAAACLLVSKSWSWDYIEQASFRRNIPFALGRLAGLGPYHFARIQNFFWLAAAPLSHGPSFEAGRRITVVLNASGSANWYPDQLPRNELIHQGLSQICWPLAKRASSSVDGLTSRSSIKLTRFLPPHRGRASEPLRCSGRAPSRRRVCREVRRRQPLRPAAVSPRWGRP